MTNTANTGANFGGVVPRGPGKPPGYPKPPNCGRKKRTRNRVTKEIAGIAQKHGKTIAHSLVKEFNATDDLDVEVKIASLVLSYSCGQPTRRSEVFGPDGKAIEPPQILEPAERVAEMFGRVADTEGVAEKLGDQSLRVIQAASTRAASAIGELCK